MQEKGMRKIYYRRPTTYRREKRDPTRGQPPVGGQEGEEGSKGGYSTLRGKEDSTGGRRL